MEKYRYWVDNKCRYNLYLESCSRCLFENLCLYESNQERVWRDTHEVGKTTEKNSSENM